MRSRPWHDLGGEWRSGTSSSQWSTLVVLLVLVTGCFAVSWPFYPVMPVSIYFVWLVLGMLLLTHRQLRVLTLYTVTGALTLAVADGLRHRSFGSARASGMLARVVGGTLVLFQSRRQRSGLPVPLGGAMLADPRPDPGWAAAGRRPPLGVPGPIRQAGHVPTPTSADLAATPGDAWRSLRAHPRRAVAVVVTLALLLVLALAAVLTGDVQPEPPRAAPSESAPPPTPSASPQVDTTRDATYAPIRPGYPDRVVVPSLDVDAPVVPIKAPDRTLIPPADPQVLGWWADGARPGADTGSALVVGHTVSSGGGALDDLESLADGDQVLVRSTSEQDGEGRARTMEYVVETVRVYRKGTLAQRAAELFSQSVEGRLVLLTCEDWDGTRYLSNVVVTALPVDPDEQAPDDASPTTDPSDGSSAGPSTSSGTTGG